MNEHEDCGTQSSERIGRHRILSSAAWQRIRNSLGLSEHEIAIIQAIFDSRTARSLACELDISPYTIRSYTHRLYQKLGVRTRAELVVRIFEQYLDGEPHHPS